MIVVGQIVDTPYGESIVLTLRKDKLKESVIVEVRPTKWQLAGGQTPTFYLNLKDIKIREIEISVDVGHTVDTPYGICKVISIKTSHSSSIVVQPIQWQLAGGQIPTFFLNPRDAKIHFVNGRSVVCTFGTGN
jgi:hypothetical protein